MALYPHPFLPNAKVVLSECFHPEVWHQGGLAKILANILDVVQNGLLKTVLDDVPWRPG